MATHAHIANVEREIIETTFTEEFRGFFGKTEISYLEVTILPNL